MKKSSRYLFILTGIVLLIITGCKSKPPQADPIQDETVFIPEPEPYEYLTNPGFPTVFFGTWVREEPQGLTSTRTFTTNTYKISGQPTHWVLVGVSGDKYTISPSNYRALKGTETIRYVNGKLIFEPCGGDGENQCGGVWVRQ